MRLRVMAVALVVFGGACSPKPAALQKALASDDPAQRERAATALREIYAKSPAAIGDHGEQYWLDALTPNGAGRLSAEERKERRASASPIPYNEGPVDCCVVPSTLDDFWVATLRYERLDKGGMPMAGAYLGYDKLERDPKIVQAPSPATGFVGTSTLYYPNGAVARVVEYRADKTERTREYYVEGPLREEKVYSSDARAIPVGPLVHYYRNGKVAYEQAYTDGKKNGVFRDFDEAGRPTRESPYLDDKREGTWKTWNATGALELCIQYKADQEVARGCP